MKVLHSPRAWAVRSAQGPDGTWRSTVTGVCLELSEGALWETRGSGQRPRTAQSGSARSGWGPFRRLSSRRKTRTGSPTGKTHPSAPRTPVLSSILTAALRPDKAERRPSPRFTYAHPWSGPVPSGQSAELARIRVVRPPQESAARRRRPRRHRIGPRSRCWCAPALPSTRRAYRCGCHCPALPGQQGRLRVRSAPPFDRDCGGEWRVVRRPSPHHSVHRI